MRSKARLRQEGLKFVLRGIVRGNTPAEDLAQAAEEEEADLIVIGVRNRSALGKLLLGSERPGDHHVGALPRALRPGRLTDPASSLLVSRPVIGVSTYGHIATDRWDFPAVGDTLVRTSRRSGEPAESHCSFRPAPLRRSSSIDSTGSC